MFGVFIPSASLESFMNRSLQFSLSLLTSSQDQTVQVTTLQKQNNQLQTELEEAKNVQRKQDTLIQSLKEVNYLEMTYQIIQFHSIRGPRMTSEQYVLF